MSRRESSEPEDLQPARMSGAATNMAEYAAGISARPESRSHTAVLKFSPSERTILVGLPGLSDVLKERLDIPSRGVKSFEFTLHDLACMCLALARALLDVEGRAILKLLSVAGKVTDRLDHADAELVSTSRTRNAAKKSKPKGSTRR